MRRIFKKIALVGMMGSGKTTLGVMAAKRLGWEFVDADTVIVDEAGMTIPEIFRRHGEEEFRRRELAAIRRIIERPGNHVVATGGGAFCQDEVREYLLERAVTVFLNVSEPDLLRRLAASDPADRPMLSGDWRERVSDLVRLRYPLYARARLTVDIGDEEPEETLEQLLAALPEEFGACSLAHGECHAED